MPTTAPTLKSLPPTPVPDDDALFPAIVGTALELLLLTPYTGVKDCTVLALPKSLADDRLGYELVESSSLSSSSSSLLPLRRLLLRCRDEELRAPPPWELVDVGLALLLDELVRVARLDDEDERRPLPARLLSFPASVLLSEPRWPRLYPREEV